MICILSPAKKMREDLDTLPSRDLPRFLDRTERLLEALRAMSPAQLKTLWACNDAIAEQNVERLRRMDLRKRLTPALLAYDGIQYQYMAPGVFETPYFDYVQDHVRILSGFYGILRPFDGVTPYRLEMQARLAVDGCRDLYQFWGRSLYDALCEETNVIIDLASAEYSRCVRKFLEPHVRCVRCCFAQRVNGKLVEKGVYVKMARGEMVRYMAETSARTVDDLRGFNRLGHRYSPEDSGENELVFLKP